MVSNINKRLQLRYIGSYTTFPIYIVFVKREYILYLIAVMIDEVVPFIMPVPYHLQGHWTCQCLSSVFCLGRKRNAAGCRTSGGRRLQGVEDGAWGLEESVLALQNQGRLIHYEQKHETVKVVELFEKQTSGIENTLWMKAWGRSCRGVTEEGKSCLSQLAVV